MAAFTTLAAVATAAVSGIGAISQSRQQRKQRREARRAQEKAEIEAREAGKLKGPDSNDVRVKVGAATKKNVLGGDDELKGTAKRSGTTGLGGLGVSAAKVGGL